MRPEVKIGDIIETKKAHPCGKNRWKILRTGADFKLKCKGCGREFMTPRAKCEKKIKSIASANIQTEDKEKENA